MKTPKDIQDWWHERWQQNQIGFHLDAPHPWLIRYWPQFSMPSLHTLFVPLCGKTHDVAFFLQEGYQVVANELDESAIQALFDDLQLEATITDWKAGKIYSTKNLTVFVGDFFELTSQEIIQVDAIYDRAALIALPPELRLVYAKHLQELCPSAAQFLITLDYDQAQMDGPPFSVDPDEVHEHYHATYNIQLIKRKDIIVDEARFKERGLTSLHQAVYFLLP